jgi:hypothetical protein
VIVNASETLSSGSPPLLSYSFPFTQHAFVFPFTKIFQKLLVLGVHLIYTIQIDLHL